MSGLIGHPAAQRQHVGRVLSQGHVTVLEVNQGSASSARVHNNKAICALLLAVMVSIHRICHAKSPTVILCLHVFTFGRGLLLHQNISQFLVF